MAETAGTTVNALSSPSLCCSSCDSGGGGASPLYGNRRLTHWGRSRRVLTTLLENLAGRILLRVRKPTPIAVGATKARR